MSEKIEKFYQILMCADKDATYRTSNLGVTKRWAIQARGPDHAKEIADSVLTRDGFGYRHSSVSCFAINENDPQVQMVYFRRIGHCYSAFSVEN